jgi:cold shock protein
MPQGKIKKIVADRGFGFISGVGRNEVFFHSTSVKEVPFEQLSEGQVVDYEIEDTPPRRGKGPSAVWVKLAN